MVRIAIVGMGLLGTSLGMALRGAAVDGAGFAALQVTGYDQNPRHTSEARGRLAIDREARSLRDAVHDAQMVVLAVPVQAMQPLLRELVPLMAAGAVITDVASTKAQAMAWATELVPAGIDFIGGHPMAGREASGPAAAVPDLFRGAIWCLCAPVSARPEAVDLVERLIGHVGARVYHIGAAEHDAYVAGISHLPFQLATVLADITSRGAGWREMSTLAASGYRDMTRLAGGDAEMHRDICITNREPLVHWINRTIERLLDVREQLERDDAAALLALFADARRAREAWLAARPGLRPGEAEFEASFDVESPSLFGRIGRPPRQRRP